MRELLPPSFFARDTAGVARDLLGCVLVSHTGGTTTAGRIVEVEAYVGPHDPAAHGYRDRRTRRNRQLFAAPATAYVYFIYGMYWCLNAVTEQAGYPAAVLIRALEPLDGLAVMRRRRRRRDERALCSGPGKLCQALGITGTIDGLPLHGDPIGIYAPEPAWSAGTEPAAVRVTPRIGVRRARDWPLRFVLAGSPYASRPERPTPSRAR